MKASKECYYCRIDKPLSAYKKAEGKYTLPSMLGHCMACEECCEPSLKKKRILDKYPNNKKWYKEEE